MTYDYCNANKQSALYIYIPSILATSSNFWNIANHLESSRSYSALATPKPHVPRHDAASQSQAFHAGASHSAPNKMASTLPINMPIMYANYTQQFS